MINLDSILKSRDVTLPTKVCLVKAMVFTVVVCGCESWTIKKAEHWGRSQDGGGIGRVITFSSTNSLKEQQNGEQSLQNNF